MPLYSKYTINSDDHFDAYYFPMIVAEVARIYKATAHIPSSKRVALIMRMAKRNRLSDTVLLDNYGLAELVHSGELSLTNISSLLQAGAGNEQFTSELEAYLNKELGG